MNVDRNRGRRKRTLTIETDENLRKIKTETKQP